MSKAEATAAAVGGVVVPSAFEAALLASAEDDKERTTWKHARPFELHPADPDLTRTYVQGGTGNTETGCRTCGEVVILADR